MNKTSLADLAHNIDTSLGLMSNGGYTPSSGSRNEKWLRGNQGWYFITADGRLYKWDGLLGATGQLIAEFAPSYYLFPERLYSASLSSFNNDNLIPMQLVTDQTRMILLGSSPGKLPPDTNNRVDDDDDDDMRLSKDFSLAESLFSSAYRSFLASDSQDEERLNKFLAKWYSAALWGDLRRRHPLKYQEMLSKRLKSLLDRRRDIASVLYGCSPPLTSQDDWKAIVPSNTLFVAGSLDKKYSSIGRAWKEMRGGIARYIELDNVGHALLVEEPEKVASIISGFMYSILYHTVLMCIRSGH